MTQKQPSQFQRILTALAASFLVFSLWTFIYQKFWGPPPQTQPAGATTTSAPAEQAPTSMAAATGSAPAFAEASKGQATGGLVVVGGESADTVKLGDAADGSAYPLQLELSPRGASVKQASLRGYYETVKKEQPYRIVQPLIIGDKEDYSLQTVRIRFPDLNQEVQLDTVLWAVGPADDKVVFSVQINKSDGAPLARVSKTYAIPSQLPKKDGIGETHDMLLTSTIENLTGAPLRAVLVQQGPVGFRQTATRQEDRAVIVAMWEQGSEKDGPTAKAHYRSEFAKKDLLELGRDDESRRIAWIAESNQYFTCIMAPVGRTGASDPVRFERADAVHLSKNPDGLSEDLTFRFITTPITIAAGQATAVGFDCYIGPKSKKFFQSVPAYEQRNYYAVISSSFYFCAPTALVGVMMALLNAFHRIPPHNYGIAIFLLVLVVRTILHPITKKSQVNMMKMQKQMATLQPKIAAAREKHGKDRAALNQATMEVYREAGVNPAGSVLTCIPLMLQIPIWAALWAALSSTVEMRHAPLDGWWIKDLTQPDGLFPLGGSYTIPFISYIMGGTPITAINLLPILLSISQLLQAKYMPRSNAPVNPDNPDQMEQQRKMMMFMSIFFFFMFYNMPSGLNLYIMTSNVTAILEQWRIRKHIEEEEKKGKFNPPTGPRSKGWLQRKWENLQKEAEEARQLQGGPARKKR